MRERDIFSIDELWSAKFVTHCCPVIHVIEHYILDDVRRAGMMFHHPLNDFYDLGEHLAGRAIEAFSSVTESLGAFESIAVRQ